ncbi:MAG: hypothetical protein WAU31_00165 [Candidatus Moraniibacteriota bacterium]
MNENTKKGWKHTLIDVVDQEKATLAVLILLIVAFSAFSANYFYLGKSVDESVFAAILMVVGIIFCLSFIVPHIFSELKYDDADSEVKNEDRNENNYPYNGDYCHLDEILGPEFFGIIKEKLASERTVNESSEELPR